MTTGYSIRLQNANRRADDSNAGVRLGRVCIERDIPVTTVARHLGVSRATVYNWFCGVSAPQTTTIDLIESYLSSLE